MMDKLTLVIPAKNESESLPTVLKELEIIKIKTLVVIPVEDKTTKESIQNFNCKIIEEKNGKGYGNALRTGINQVETDFFCIFNADGSFDPKDLNKMYQILDKNNADFVFCSRYEKNSGSDDDTFLTYVGNKIFTLLCNIFFKLRITDVLYTYVMGKTEKYKSLNLESNDFTFCVELPIKAKFNNFRLLSLASYERSRLAGIKKVNEFKDGFLILISILRLLLYKK
jgi:glycosyltransferase involved in cell wall biosynthesis